MEKFSSYWRATILAAIFLHGAAIFAMPYVVPIFSPAKNFQTDAELEWIDVELSDATIIEAQENLSVDAQETLPTFNAEDLIVPEISVPEIKIEPLNPPPSQKPVELPKPPSPAANKPTAPKNDSPAEKVDTPQNIRQFMAKPPVAVKEVFPEKGSGLGYKGYVSIAVHIGKDGKIKSTEILQSSGRYFVDEIALKAAVQWTFRPALDQIGRPMECDKIITFDFKKFA